jgi:catechol 2,3-dioxygenase-like lactoylglutathione lyase family enzyme
MPITGVAHVSLTVTDLARSCAWYSAGVGSIAVQLAREIGTVVIGTGRARTAKPPSDWEFIPSWTWKPTSWTTPAKLTWCST